jgi:flagellar biosynthetic protein FliR
VQTLDLDLSHFLTLELWRILLVFVRVSAAFLLLPGMGEPSVPVRIRFLAALAVAAAVAPGVPGMPDTVPEAPRLILAVLAEAATGALLGALARTVISGVLIGGQIISNNIVLTNIFTPGLAIDQSSTVGGALYAGILAVLFAAHGEVPILRALAGSYTLLPPGHFPAAGASLRSMVGAGSEAFRLGGQLALPFMLLALVFNASLALVNRAMPALPVFMIANPAIVLLGLYLLAATAPGLVDRGLSGWTDLATLLH